MRLLLRVLGMKHHPSNLEQTPFISVQIKIPNNDICVKAHGSNALPPVWKEEYIFNNIVLLPGSIQIALYESRIFMRKEEIARNEFCLDNLPIGKMILEWIPLRSILNNKSPMYVLLMMQIVNDNEEFNKNMEFVRMNLPDSLPFVYESDSFFLPDDMIKEKIEEPLNGNCLKDILSEMNVNKY